MHPYKRRRTATSVLAGDFDPSPGRDVLTSLLNGVGPYKVVEREETTRRDRKKEKRDRERERRKAKTAEKAKQKEVQQAQAGPSNASGAAAAPRLSFPIPIPATTTSSFWRARPAIHIPSAGQRPSSVTPPPSPRSTPDRYVASSSRNSSKRPYTPSDFHDLHHADIASSATASPQPAPQRKRRAAARKGWKGWVEGSPPPSDKLINLDVAQVLPERRTRSGKNFDAIGVGKEGWV
ncbi:hypothetical protein NEOLEDRAFT_1136157 [Neolentinus lepideus HHB14362 ss-1]|uniref:Uncharacterized protein n=1 Tax=Neolentinus lepideus HHB14362 ss-1 TaxID=1314782 RepID=A0A165RDR0_9AGAM|nr:hypothetical protein NEOLEDRAFT_1136157 [Neolentinus lepideus HHB14362 ss-1]